MASLPSTDGPPPRSEAGGSGNGHPARQPECGDSGRTTQTQDQGKDADLLDVASGGTSFNDLFTIVHVGRIHRGMGRQVKCQG